MRRLARWMVLPVAVGAAPIACGMPARESARAVGAVDRAAAEPGPAVRAVDSERAKPWTMRSVAAGVGAAPLACGMPARERARAVGAAERAAADRAAAEPGPAVRAVDSERAKPWTMRSVAAGVGAASELRATGAEATVASIPLRRERRRVGSPRVAALVSDRATARSPPRAGPTEASRASSRLSPAPADRRA